ncbi:MAG: PT domain-containing protein [Lewinellaceae bacterium]|nr:PT domain-containing protein [Lewinellaceae bacterium]
MKTINSRPLKLSHPAIQPSNHPAIQPSNHPTIQPSNHPAIQPSSHPTIQPSSHPAPLLAVKTHFAHQYCSGYTVSSGSRAFRAAPG